MRLLRTKFPYWVVAIIVVIALVLATVLYLTFNRLGRTTISATFSSAVGISEGTDVRVLGVTVGSVDEVIPEGDTVHVRLHVDRGVTIPADANAVQVTPSVIPDRVVQITPAYTEGEVMESGTHLPIERTATPVEVDEIYDSVQGLTEALGPDGANRDGALDRFIESSADTLGENGAALGRSIDELSRASTTLADSSQDISSTIVNLQEFVTMLAENDAQVRQFNSQMATFNRNMADQRENLQGSLHELSFALADVARLVRDNQDSIRNNADRLASISQITADQQDHVVEILKKAPLALSNVINAYDPDSGSLHNRLNLREFQDPVGTLCNLLRFSRYNPGAQENMDLENLFRADIDECEDVAPELNANLRAENPDLPLGALGAELKQGTPIPGMEPPVVGWQTPPRSERGDN